MNEISATETERIENNLVPKILKSLGRENESVRCKISFPENCFFLSYVCFVDLTFSKHENNNEKRSNDVLRLVIKKPPLNGAFVAQMEMVKHFHNEILFYTKFASGSENFPSCVYTAEGDLENCVIVTENITTLGYQICPKTYDIPYEYVLSAVNEIGRFHAIGYVMKEQETEKFNKIVSDIQDPRFHEKIIWFSKYVNIIATRPIEWLRRNNCEKEFCDRMEKFLGNGFREIILASLRPVEPLATICHGDFTRNNIFFRKINGKLDAMLFDFALILYSSPAIDISTFLYLNCSAEDRITKFDELYRSYHDTLYSHLRNAGIANLERYSYDKMLADYKRRAAYGYMIAAFFLPVIHGVCPVDLNDIINDTAKSALITRESGGEAMTEIFGKMIIELRDSGCLDHMR